MHVVKECGKVYACFALHPDTPSALCAQELTAAPAAVFGVKYTRMIQRSTETGAGSIGGTSDDDFGVQGVAKNSPEECLDYCTDLPHCDCVVFEPTSYSENPGGAGTCFERRNCDIDNIPQTKEAASDVYFQGTFHVMPCIPQIEHSKPLALMHIMHRLLASGLSSALSALLTTP